MIDADAGFWGAIIGLLKWLGGGVVAMLCWVVRGIISDAKEMKASLNKHEVESAARLGRMEAVVEQFGSTATRIHERIDELNNYLRGKK